MNHNIEMGSEGLKRLASMYLDAFANREVPPDPRMVKQAMVASKSYEMNMTWEKTQDEMQKVLMDILSRFEPSARKGRALQEQA